MQFLYEAVLQLIDLPSKANSDRLSEVALEWYVEVEAWPTNHWDPQMLGTHYKMGRVGEHS